MVGETLISFTGGMNVPSRSRFFSRLNANFPLAVLDVDTSALELRLLPPASLTSKPRRLFRRDVELVFPVNPGKFMSSGIGIDGTLGERYFFWTRGVEEVLTAIQFAGFPISKTPQSAGLRWLT